MDETLALLSVLPFLGYFFSKLHAWWHSKFHHKCHEESCHDEHVEHYSPYGNHGPESISEEDFKYLSGTPVPLKIMIPVEIEEGYVLTPRGLVVGSILGRGPMTHEQIAELYPKEDHDKIYEAINDLVEEGALVLDGDLLKEGNIFNDTAGSN
jgi:hypothetical protein